MKYFIVCFMSIVILPYVIVGGVGYFLTGLTEYFNIMGWHLFGKVVYLAWLCFCTCCTIDFLSSDGESYYDRY